MLRHRRFLSAPLSPPPLHRIPTAHTECPRGRLKTTLSATRLSIRPTRVNTNIIIIHIIIVSSNPDPLHLSAHRIIPGISLKFYPIRLQPLRTAAPCRSSGGSGRTAPSRSSSRTFSTRILIRRKRKGKSWASPLGCESTHLSFSGFPLAGRLIDLSCLFLVTRTYQRSVVPLSSSSPCIALTTTPLSPALPTGFRINVVSSNVARTKSQPCTHILRDLLPHSRQPPPIHRCHPSIQTYLLRDPRHLMSLFPYPPVTVESGRVALARPDLVLGHTNSMPSKTSTARHRTQPLSSGPHSPLRLASM